ncbi:uncharacterized protein BDZ99DRAFT_492952 [Mytilinidion resinicola]|uniref:Uncharacterized protein n=1 Tax=Mytilinidion resinicola TaxID=574789 RepID=A0A6A6ZA14_9PEZI|nr:uncharacterized protein BDZ99DRAFT_492952 [Mytilinidion resinicola]KAF2817047.1 hypothetical protein BDZ99DRAFT_492952 [Mytilinidion resinicola]
MGRGQPYQYGAPKSIADDPFLYNGFNPKAVTMASRQPPPPPRPKQEGPLINFNRHPDSYLILPYGKTDAKPMSPKTKTVIKWTRWLQLLLRVLQLIAAIGILVCVIAIRGTQPTEGWVIRIPAGVDIATVLYAIYHLVRTAKHRTPGSSASYHFFALIIDAGLIPFYVFTALLSNRNYHEAPGTSGRWRTLFPTDGDANKILQTTWLTATAIAGLHCFSLFLDLYLVVIFRKITHLPPDMNPLEDNLTSRRKTKHKAKNSSISAMIPLTADEKKINTQTNSTTSLSNRGSQADPLIPVPDVSKVAFFHTRANSDVSYSPHNPTTARLSRTDLANSIYQQPASVRNSRADLHRREDLHRRDDSDGETLAQRKSFLAAQSIQRSRPNSFVSAMNDEKSANNSNNGTPQRISRESLQSDNWFVHASEDDDPYTTAPSTNSRSHSPTKSKSGTTTKYNQLSGDISDDDSDIMIPQPLRMNPPTPPPAAANNFKSSPSNSSYPSRPATGTSTSTNGYNNPYNPPVLNTNTTPKLARTMTVTSISTDSTFMRSPTNRPLTPKSRYYGDLKAATQGIRDSPGNTSPTRGSPAPSPSKYAPHNAYPSRAKAYTTNASPTKVKGHSFASIRRTGEAGYTPVTAQSPRVVSRSGVDIDGDYGFGGYEDGDLASGRKRDVSGKVAEEGRGGVGTGGRWKGMGLGGLSYRKVSGVA